MLAIPARGGSTLLELVVHATIVPPAVESNKVRLWVPEADDSRSPGPICVRWTICELSRP